MLFLTEEVSKPCKSQLQGSQHTRIEILYFHHFDTECISTNITIYKSNETVILKKKSSPALLILWQNHIKYTYTKSNNSFFSYAVINKETLLVIVRENFYNKISAMPYVKIYVHQNKKKNKSEKLSFIFLHLLITHL
jgi:hypothetical protein